MESTNREENTHIVKAVIFATIGALFLSLMALCAKRASPHTTESVITFFRFAVTGLYIFTILFVRRLQGNHITIKTHHFGMHALRVQYAYCLIIH
jgi:hypothetical protein